jgi:hypothetical protein
MYGRQELIEESVSQVTATNSVELGTRRIHSGNEYTYVYNKSSSTASVGYAMVRIGANASATSRGVIPAVYCNSGTSVGISVALDTNGTFRSRSATTGALYPSVGVALTAASAATALCTFTVTVNCV